MNNQNENLEILLPHQAAKRWGITVRSLERWRCQGKGPLFLKIGGKICYRMSDIKAWEEFKLRRNTICHSPLLNIIDKDNNPYLKEAENARRKSAV